jgi:hypothetical protein
MEEMTRPGGKSGLTVRQYRRTEFPRPAPQPAAKRALTPGEILGLAIFGAAVVVVEVGFFFADPLLTPLMKFVRAAMVLLTPCIAIGAGWLYVNVRRGRVSKMAVLALFLSGAIFVLLAVPTAMTIRDYRLEANLLDYHPFLQLSPPDYKDRPLPAGQTPVKIFCLGGSTTEFSDTKGRRWTGLLETELQSRYRGKPIQVYNFGRQWYTTEHLLINYTINLRQHKPDVLVVMEAINDLLPNADFSNLSVGPFRDDYRHFLGPLYRVLQRETFWGNAEEIGARIWYSRPRQVIDTDRFPGLAPYERNLRTLVDYAKADGVKVVLMTQPTLLKESMSPQEKAVLIMANFEAVGPRKRWSSRTAWRGMTQYDDAVRRVARQSGAHLIDLDKTIPKTTEFFTDDVHYHAIAMDMIADAIASEFQSQKIL